MKQLFDARKLNWWLVLAGIGCNFFLMVAVTTGASLVLREGAGRSGISQAILMLGAFGATFSTGLLAGWLARGDGATYGLICSAGNLVVVTVAIPAGVFMLLVAVTAFSGGINGGLVSERWHRRAR